MKIWQWIVFGVILYVLGLIVYAPASLITSLIHQASNAQISIAEPKGTVFSGSAAKVSFNGIVVNDVNWHLSPLHLLLLKATIDVKGGAIRDMEQAYVSGRASVSLVNFQNISLQDMQTFIPVKSILAQVKLPVFITAEGRVRVNIQSLQADPSCLHLLGVGGWQNASIADNGKVTQLGSFDANLNCNNGQYTINIDEQNILNLDANITVGIDGSYQVNGKFKPDPTLPTEIKQAASFFGRANSQGFYEIKL
ncbi:type II secretion system protein N [Agaribacter flavus]|uniref:Type II secretion system protein N n=1 Tax=Agaribacter flavus TaxID=1902781 RepID=A0ABV7FTZ8_9ALTE